jgi:hypothetical protein
MASLVRGSPDLVRPPASWFTMAAPGRMDSGDLHAPALNQIHDAV